MTPESLGYDHYDKIIEDGLKRLGLSFDPFTQKPDKEILHDAFVDREKQWKEFLYAFKQDENILIYGLAGIGKSAFLLYILNETERKENYLCIKTSMAGENSLEFLKCIAKALCTELLKESKVAKEICSRLRGISTSERERKETEGGFEAVLKGKRKKSKSKGTSITENIDGLQLKSYIDEMLADAYAIGYEKIAILVDEMDKLNGKEILLKIIKECRDVLHFPCTFVLTGRTEMITDELFSITMAATQRRAFRQLCHFREMDDDDLVEMALRYLAFAGNRNAIEPSILNELALLSFGTPSIMIDRCTTLIQKAVENGFDKVTRMEIKSIYHGIGENIFNEISKKGRHLIKIIHSHNGSIHVTDKIAKKYGATKQSVYDQLKILARRDAIQKVNINGITRYVINYPLFVYMNESNIG